MTVQQIGKYRVDRRIGGGGMGSVYQAHDPVLDRTTDRGSHRRHGIALRGHEHQVVAATSADDAGLDSAPQQRAVVRRLPAAAGVEGRPVEDDALGRAVQDHGVPLAQRLVRELEPGGPAVGVRAHAAQ